MGSVCKCLSVQNLSDQSEKISWWNFFIAPVCSCLFTAGTLRSSSIPWHANVLCCGTVLDVRLAHQTAGFNMIRLGRDIWKEITLAFISFFFKYVQTGASHSHRMDFSCIPVHTSNLSLMSVPSRPEPISHQHQSSPCDLQADSTGALSSSIAATSAPLLLVSVSSACQTQCYCILKLRAEASPLKRKILLFLSISTRVSTLFLWYGSRGAMRVTQAIELSSVNLKNCVYIRTWEIWCHFSQSCEN